jgi:hypothetical protein
MSAGKSIDAPQGPLGRPVFGEEERSVADRPYDGGSGAPGFVGTVERATNELRTQDRAAALGPGETASAAGEDFWGRGVHAGA